LRSIPSALILTDVAGTLRGARATSAHAIPQ